jgi:hypothetical protein
LADADPAAHLPDLARSLTNLGAFLSQLGRREQAIPPADPNSAAIAAMIEIGSRRRSNPVRAGTDVRTRRSARTARGSQEAKLERSWWEAAHTVGSLATGIAAVAALLLTYQSLTVTQRGQVSDRFGRAVEQLGADTIDVRLGGIYALEQLMRDSPDDQPTVIEVLSAYIRTRTPARTDTPAKHRPEKRPVRLVVDVQAALTVLGRRDPDHDRYARINLTDIDLTDTDLTEVNLAGADLRRATLRYTHLPGVNLFRADLRGADLTGANLGNGANLRYTHLDNANLTDADLKEADLTGASLPDTALRGADLHGATLAYAVLSDADLTGAKLTHTNLAHAILTGAVLTCVRVNDGTVWPSRTRLPPPPRADC